MGENSLIKCISRFLEVQNTTLLDAIILNRIKALEAAANASVVYLERSSNASINASSITEEVPDAATTQGPGTTTQDSTPFATTEDSVTTASPQQQTTARPETTTATVAAVEVSSGPGFQSDSLQQQPRQNLTVTTNDDDDEELSFLNDAPAVPSDLTTTTPIQAEAAKTPTAEKTLVTEAVASTTIPSAAPVTDRKTEPVELSTSASPTEPTTSEVQDTTRTVALTVPESIFHTTLAPSAEQLQTTTTSAVQNLKESKPPTSAKKASSLPTILRSLVDNVFDYYDYIDYYVPGQKRNVSALSQEKGSAEERRKIPESMMDMVKEQLSKHTVKNETVPLAEADDELPQGDEPVKDTSELTTTDPDYQELQKELVTQMFVDLHRMTKPSLQESTTAPTTRRAQAVTQQPTTPRTEPVTTSLPRQTEKESVVPTTSTEQQVSAAQDVTTAATITLVKSGVGTSQRSGLNLLVENLAAAQPEESVLTTQAAVSTSTTPANQQTTLTSGTPPATTLPTTVTTPEATTPASTPRATTPEGASQQPLTTQSPTTEPATTLRPRTVPINALNEEQLRTTPAQTTKAPTTVSEAAPSSTPAPATVTERTQPAEVSTPVITTVTTTTVSATTPAPPASTSTTPSATAAVEALAESTAPPAVTSSELSAGPSQNATVVPLLTTPEPTTVGVTVPATTAAPRAASPTTKVPQENADTGSNLLQADQPQKSAPGIAKNQTAPTAPSHNNDVEYIDYVYYYDYVDVPDNTTTNGTASARNTQPMLVKKNVTQLRA